MNKVIHETALNLLGVVIISGLVLFSSHTFADENESSIDTVRLTVPIACTMRGVGVNSHTATLNPGTYSGESGNEYENGIGKTTLTAICNDDNGFSIYAIGFTGNEYGVTNLIGQNTSGTIATKAYASGDTTSNWSMKLTKVDNPVSGDPVTYNPQNLTITTSYDTWHAIPADYTKVAEYHANTGSSTTDTTLGVKLETTYAAYIASNQAADTYEGQVKYTMVHPYNAIKPANVTCNPNASTISEAVCMQDFAGPNGDQIASTMTLEQQYTLRDKRDGKSYTVAKLRISDSLYITNIQNYIRSCKDGCNANIYNSLPDEWKTYADSCGSDLTLENCNEAIRPQLYSVWMTQNLDLDLDSNVVYSNEDTDIGYNYLLKQYERTTWTPSASTYATDNNESWVASDTIPQSYDPGDLYWNDYWRRVSAYEDVEDLFYDYEETCMNGECDEGLYNQLPNDWQVYASSCNNDIFNCDFSLMPPHPDPDYNQRQLVEYYRVTCVYLGACNESAYAQLDDDFKAYVDSCDATFENCDMSLRPPEPEYDLDGPTLEDGTPSYHLGNYYNWTAAMALNDSSNYVGNNGVLIEQSICPAGWTLPRTSKLSGVGGSDTFEQLWRGYGYDSSQTNKNIVINSPLYSTPSGSFNGEINDISSSGNYWTAIGFASTKVSAPSYYEASSATYTTGQGTNYVTHKAYRREGYSVRCIARPVSHIEGVWAVIPDPFISH